jgi:multicomponent Na+:H+ antiporter subunit D
MEHNSILALAALTLPLLGGAVALPLRRLGDGGRMTVLLLVSAASAALAIALIPAALAGPAPQAVLVHFTPQVWLQLRVDPMGALFGATVSLMFFLALVYSHGYLRRDGSETRYLAFFMLAHGWMLGVAWAGNLITLLVFYELFSILVYPLVVHEQTPAALRAGTKYIVYILLGGSLVLLGVILCFFLAGDRPFMPGGIFAAGADGAMLRTAFWCLLAGFGVKAAIMPLHGWVPDVHPAAPAPFSALLSGVMVAAGTFGILRVVFEVFGVELAATLGVMPWLAGLAAVSVLFGAVMAAAEDELKRRLAWSTISQMAYVLLAVALLAPEVTVGAVAHITHHAFLKGALFFCAGVLATGAGVRRVSEMRGIARRMPLTMTAFTIAALGIVGVPPLSGFIGKWVMGVGMLQAGHPWLLLVLLGGALLAAWYLLQPVWLAWFAVGDDAPPPRRDRPEAPRSMLFVLVAATAISIALGLAAALPGMPLSLARRAVLGYFGGG